MTLLDMPNFELIECLPEVSSQPEVFLGEVTLKICSKFTGEHPCRSEISTKLFCNFIEIALRNGYSPVNLLHIFRAPFPKKHLWTAASDLMNR